MPSLLTAKGATMHSSLTHGLYAGCAPLVDSSLCPRQRAPKSLFEAADALVYEAAAADAEHFALIIIRVVIEVKDGLVHH